MYALKKPRIRPKSAQNMPKKAKTTCEMKNSENTQNPVLRPRGDAESCEGDTFHAILHEWCLKMRPERCRFM